MMQYTVPKFLDYWMQVFYIFQFVKIDAILARPAGETIGTANGRSPSEGKTPQYSVQASGTLSFSLI